MAIPNIWQTVIWYFIKLYKRGVMTMCSIMGYCAQHASKEVFLKGFERTHTRGPDAMRIIDTGQGLLGFQRLSIMGLNEYGMQPFQRGNHYVVCNGEIYGLRPVKEELMKQGFDFQGESD